MKKTYLLALAAVLFYSSCNKAFQSQNVGSLSFSIEYKDQYVTQSGTCHYSPGIQIQSGDISKLPVSFSFQGLPANVSVSPSSSTINSKNNPEFIFTANANAAVGTYAMQMVVSTNGNDPQNYNFNLHVLPKENCAVELNYYSRYFAYPCSSGSTYYVTIDSVAGSPNTMSITNFGNYGTNTQLTVLIDCGSKAAGSGSVNVYVPKQVINGDTITASGYYFVSSGTLSGLYLNDTIISLANVKTTCNLEITD